MSDRRARGLTGLLVRPLVVIALLLCASTQGSPVRGAQTPAAHESFPKAARRAIAEGRRADAEALAKARPANDPAAVAVLARLAIAHGGYDEAVKMLEPVATANPRSDAALELGLLQQRLGHADQANRLLMAVYNLGNSAPTADGKRSCAPVARRRHSHGLRTRTLYNAAGRALGGDPAIETAWGTLLLEAYNMGEALKSFQQALELDPKWAPALVGIAQTLADEDPPAAADSANKALSIDPGLAEAHLLLAQLDLDNTRYDDARNRINQVLKANDADLDARSLLAAVAYVRSGRTAFDAEAARVLTINPKYGELYRVAGDLSARNYRFDEAVALTREAVALDPSNTRAYGDLGLHLMRTGDEPEARKALDRAFKEDPYDRVTFNLLQLLDTLQKFDVVQDGDLTFKFDPAESAILREYAVPLAQRHWGRSRRSTVHPQGADPHRGVSKARRLRRPQPRAPRLDWSARRLLRAGREHRLAACPRAGDVLLGGDPLARARPCRHAADVQPARAALADRRDLRVRGRARTPRMGT